MSSSEKDRVAEFTEFRQRMNERILGHDNQVVRRFFALDTQTYKDGALDLKTKELLGLVASMVLRCVISSTVPKYWDGVHRHGDAARYCDSFAISKNHWRGAS